MLPIDPEVLAVVTIVLAVVVAAAAATTAAATTAAAATAAVLLCTGYANGPRGALSRRPLQLNVHVPPKQTRLHRQRWLRRQRAGKVRPRHISPRRAVRVAILYAASSCTPFTTAAGPSPRAVAASGTKAVV